MHLTFRWWAFLSACFHGLPAPLGEIRWIFSKHDVERMTSYVGYAVFRRPPVPLCPLCGADVQGSLCRTRMCPFHDLLHVSDGSRLHELRLVFGKVLETAGVQLALEPKLVRARHHRGQSARSWSVYQLTCVWSSNVAGCWLRLRLIAPSVAVFSKERASRRRDCGHLVRLGVSVFTTAGHHQR